MTKQQQKKHELQYDKFKRLFTSNRLQVLPSAVIGFVLESNSGQEIGCSMPTARALTKIFIEFLQGKCPSS